MRTLAFVLLASGASALIAPTALRSIRTAASPALAVRRAAPVVLQGGDYTQKTRLAEEVSAPFAKVLPPAPSLPGDNPTFPFFKGRPGFEPAHTLTRGRSPYHRPPWSWGSRQIKMRHQQTHARELTGSTR